MPKTREAARELRGFAGSLRMGASRCRARRPSDRVAGALGGCARAYLNGVSENFGRHKKYTKPATGHALYVGLDALTAPELEDEPYDYPD